MRTDGPATRTPSLRPPVYAYEFFAGAGGLHLGLEYAGFSFVLATDIEPSAQATHLKNWPHIPFLLADIRNTSAQQMIDLAGGIRPDIVCGGPPCQGFSTLGDKLSSDTRNTLFKEYARLVASLDPNFVLIENVKSLATMYHGQYRDYILKTFQGIGFTMYEAVLNAANFGVPQARERIFFFGTKLSVPFGFPEPTHGPGLLPFETVGKAIMDLTGSSEVSNHIVLNHSRKVVERYEMIPEGGKLPPPEDLPEEIRRKNFGSTYKRLHRGLPSLTLVPGNNAFPVHPTENRSLTPREAARLQTFPDKFVFIGDRRRQCILVGNAVPPLLAAKVGHAIREHIERKPAKKISKPAVFRSEVEFSSPIIPLGQLATLPPKNGFIDLFAGAGGFTIGFARGGWRPLLSVDTNENCTATHRTNFPTVPHLEIDLSNSDSKEHLIERFIGQNIGIIVGGPPCQGFSVFGKRRFVATRGHNPHKDPRNRLVYSFLELVRGLSPRWFVMENVPGLANLDEGLFLEGLLDEFRSAGYKNTEARILNAADYGVPQLRRRLVIIGNNTGHIIPWPKRKFFREPREWQARYRTVGEAISDLSTDESLGAVSCHVPMKHKPLLVERYKHIPEGERLDTASLPQHLKAGYRTAQVRNYSHVFKRLHRDRPALTMVPGHNAFPIHPWLDRALTVREAARLQTFPDELEFMGPRQEQCIQVGNAFPPLLAELIANNIRKAEVNGWFPDEVPTSAYYSLVEREGEQLTIPTLEAARAATNA